MKKIFLAIVLIFISANALALGAEDLIWEGTIKTETTKDTFLPTENISGIITVFNNESAPLLGGKIVLHISQGKYEYPSQFNNNENIILEKIIDLNWVLPKSSLKTKFEINSLSPGEYRLDSYAWVGKSKLSGASNIFLGPLMVNFKVEGQKAPMEVEYKIQRSTTKFNSTIGPVGFPAQPESKINGIIEMSKGSAAANKSLKIGVKVCEWASIFCGEEKEELFNATSFDGGNLSTTSIQINSPKIPSAYEIMINAYDGQKIISSYKNRIIVSGPTAKPRKIMIDGLSTKSYSLKAIIAGSPDHFNYPTLKDFLIKAQFLKEEKILDEKIQNISEMKTIDILEKIFSTETKTFDQICLLVEKEGTILDKQCYYAPIEEIQAAYDLKNPQLVKAEWEYDEKSSSLKITLKKEKINAQIKLFNSTNQLLLERVNAEKSYEKILNVPKEDLTLIVDDMDVKQQQLIEIKLSNNQSAVDLNSGDGGEEALQCAGIVCTNGLICETAAIRTIQGDCCNTKCIKAGSIENERGLEWPPLIMLIAAIAIIILIFTIASTIRAVKK